MAIPTDMAGTTAGPMVHDVDERWVMAYAAAIDDLTPRYLDTTSEAGLVAHPVFPVCVEWPVIVAARSGYTRFGVSSAEVSTGVHATHDLTIHRAIRPGDRLSTTLETAGVVGIRPGAKVTTRLRTVDADGAPVATTTQDGIHLGVPTSGADKPDPGPPSPIVEVDRAGPPQEYRVEIDGGRAHLYTECARIWNPIHTDRAVAHAAVCPTSFCMARPRSGSVSPPLSSRRPAGIQLWFGRSADGLQRWSSCRRPSRSTFGQGTPPRMAE